MLPLSHEVAPAAEPAAAGSAPGPSGHGPIQVRYRLVTLLVVLALLSSMLLFARGADYQGTRDLRGDGGGRGGPGVVGGSMFRRPLLQPGKSSFSVGGAGLLCQWHEERH